ncbi:MAG: helix-turn-helix domain-containing protein [Sporomusaceae bacterium]|nr:helix-turn-helix domain-containing protein [Sporomusaceae bacterium]
MTNEELRAFIAEKIVNTAEAAELLGCSRQNIADLVKRGKLQPVKEMQKDRLFLKEDILARAGAGR